jgi:hypothetical protein
MIISVGVNVYPVEVEEVIHQIPGVQDTAVIGVPDERWGEAVKAVVVLEPGVRITEAEIIAYCKERLAAFKVPKSVFFEQIPRTRTGKIFKRELQEILGEWRHSNLVNGLPHQTVSEGMNPYARPDDLAAKVLKELVKKAHIIVGEYRTRVEGCMLVLSRRIHKY